MNNFQFFLELMKVPRIESKLRVFAFSITFSSQVVCSGAFCFFYSYMQNDFAISCCTCLHQFVQVNELRCNLDTINKVASEVHPFVFVFVKLVLESCTCDFKTYRPYFCRLKNQQNCVK